MAFEFILLFGWLNLASLIPKKRDQIVYKTRLTNAEAVKIFEYGKNNDGY